jgi:hypothetical protein
MAVKSMYVGDRERIPEAVGSLVRAGYKLAVDEEHLQPGEYRIIYKTSLGGWSDENEIEYSEP